MKSACRFGLLCAAILVPGMALSGQAPAIIETKVGNSEGAPLWISAGAVADAEKIVNLDLVDSLSLSQTVEKQRREGGDHLPVEKSTMGGKPLITNIPISECKRTLYSTDQEHRGGTDSTATLSDLAVHSKSIVRGSIRVIDVGFDGGVPGSLLVVEVSDVLKGQAQSSTFYVLYPVARFKIGPFHFCNAAKGFEPRSGDEILLFDFTGPVDRDGNLFAPRLDQILFQRRSGELFMPPQLKSAPDLKAIRNIADVIDRLRLNVGSPSDSRGGAQ